MHTTKHEHYCFSVEKNSEALHVCRLSMIWMCTEAAVLQVCGNARVWGDGIIPIEAAHLHGRPEHTLYASCLCLVNAKNSLLLGCSQACMRVRSTSFWKHAVHERRYQL